MLYVESRSLLVYIMHDNQIYKKKNLTEIQFRFVFHFCSFLFQREQLEIVVCVTCFARLI